MRTPLQRSLWSACLVVLPLLLNVLSAGEASAQVASGTIVGTVRDPSAALVPGAQVTCTNHATSVQYGAQTNQAGQYVCANLPPGEYRVEVSLDGFRTGVVGRLVVQVLATVSQDFTLEVGTASEQVTVAVEAPLLNTQTSDLGRVITSDEIQTLPLNGRNYLQLATLTPGVNTFYSNQTGPVRGTTFFQGGSFLAGTQNVGSGVTVGTNREIATTYQLDGMNVTNPFVGQSALLPSLEMIDQFKVVTGNAAAQLAAPASVQSVTRSGSNDLHGSLSGFMRDDALDARGFFDAVKPQASVRQFGGALGGPIVRSRAFFFGAYEGYRGDTPTLTRAIVPTAVQRSGDFSALSTPIRDPQTGAPFANNVIPEGRISPFARVFRDLLPTPNFQGTGSLAAFNYETQTEPRYESDQFTLRLDHRYSSAGTIFGRYTQTNTQNASPGYAELFGLSYPYDSRTAIVDLTRALTPSLMMRTAFGYLRSTLSVQQEGAFGRNFIEDMGLTNLAGSADPAQFGLPTVSVAGLSALGPGISFSPRGGVLDRYQIQHGYAWTRGTHTLQLGADIEYNRYDTINPTAPRGFFAFSGAFTGHAMADFLLGYPSTAIGDSGNSQQRLRYTNYEVYAQDDWRVTSRLTLNLGLRYLYYTPPRDADNGQSYFDFACNCIVTAASGRIGNGIYRPPKNNLAPRVGAAWTPFDEKTVVRGAYGLFFFPPVMAENLFLRNNPPNYTLYSIGSTPTAPVTSFFPPPLPEATPSTTTFTVDPDTATARYHQISLGVERELTPRTKLTVGYVGSRGRDLQRRINMNQAVPGDGAIASRRPLPAYGDILLQANVASSDYDALQVTVTRQMTAGLAWWGSYEWARGKDDATNEGEAPADRRNLDAEWGRSLYLVPHRFRMTVAYDLPFGRGKALLGDASSLVQGLVGGWQVNAIFLLQHGSPLTITAPALHNTGGFVPSRANQTCDGNLSRGDRTLRRFFDTSCFSAPPANTIGSSPRGAIYAPGLNNWDITLAKEAAIGARSLRFEAQFFNAFNHPQFNAPVTDVSSPAFGNLTSALRGRNIQLGLRFRF